MLSSGDSALSPGNIINYTYAHLTIFAMALVQNIIIVFDKMILCDLLLLRRNHENFKTGGDCCSE